MSEFELPKSIKAIDTVCFIVKEVQIEDKLITGWYVQCWAHLKRSVGH